MSIRSSNISLTMNATSPPILNFGVEDFDARLENKMKSVFEDYEDSTISLLASVRLLRDDERDTLERIGETIAQAKQEFEELVDRKIESDMNRTNIIGNIRVQQASRVAPRPKSKSQFEALAMPKYTSPNIFAIHSTKQEQTILKKERKPVTRYHETIICPNNPTVVPMHTVKQGPLSPEIKAISQMSKPIERIVPKKVRRKHRSHINRMKAAEEYHLKLNEIRHRYDTKDIEIAGLKAAVDALEQSVVANTLQMRLDVECRLDGIQKQLELHNDICKESIAKIIQSSKDRVRGLLSSPTTHGTIGMYASPKSRGSSTINSSDSCSISSTSSRSLNSLNSKKLSGSR